MHVVATLPLRDATSDHYFLLAALVLKVTIYSSLFDNISDTSSEYKNVVYLYTLIAAVVQE